MGTAGRAPGDLFQSTLPARGATLLEGNPGKQKLFQSTLPARGATYLLTRMVVSPLISIHAPRTGSDTACWATAPSRSNFNPRSPHGERPGESSISSQLSQFQSTLPARGATLLVNGLWHDQIFQSTLPARGATGERAHTARMLLISIHAPRTGSDALYFPRIAFARYFNPRSPHGERPSGQPEPPAASNFNPRSPHGERRNKAWQAVRAKGISTHAPRTGSDATYTGICQGSGISTHAPRTGSDTTNCIVEISTTHFNPRSPHGERQGYVLIAIKNALFQPTLPARGATRAAPRPLGHPVISTHAPRTGSDDTPQGYMMALSDFNPRSPHGERQINALCGLRAVLEISIHAPRTGSDTCGGWCK